MDLVSRQREERKQRILDVARRLIAERGFEGVTMRELAEESLVSVPTLYNLFDGKNELLFAAVEAYFLGLLGSVDRQEGKQGLAKLMAVSDTLSVQVPKHAEYARSLMAFFWGTSESSPIREFIARELTAELIVAMEQMRAKRQLVDWVNLEALGERLASLMFMTSFEWASQHMNDETLVASMRFGVATLLLGFARGKMVVELSDIIKANQDIAVVARLAQNEPRVSAQIED